jgi:hydroxyacylglutathione hydrolase
MTQLIRIGWTRVAGYLAGGVDAWRSDGHDVGAYPSVDVADLCAAQTRGERPAVLDVRQELEWRWGTIPRSHLIFVADLPRRVAELPRAEPVWVICSNGHRAAIAASLLAAQGGTPRLVGSGGVGEWRATCREREPART